MAYPPLSLTKRLIKGSKITPAENDQSYTDIETAVNGQDAKLAVALNPNGTIKNNAVSTAAIQDRAVTLAKLAFLSEFYADDTGAANAMAITFAPAPLLGAYVEGLVFWVKAIANNTGATTLAVDGLAVQNVKKFTSSGIGSLVQGDIKAGMVYALVYDGAQFLLLNPTPNGIGLSDVYASSIDVSELTTDIDLDFILPVGAQAWTTVEMWSTALLDSAANAAANVTVTMKWNTNPLLNTAVTIGAGTGAGNSGQQFVVNGDNQCYPVWHFIGPVPGGIAAAATLHLRATLATGGSIDLNTWRAWGRASCR